MYVYMHVHIYMYICIYIYIYMILYIYIYIYTYIYIFIYFMFIFILNFNVHNIFIQHIFNTSDIKQNSVVGWIVNICLIIMTLHFVWRSVEEAIAHSRSQRGSLGFRPVGDLNACSHGVAGKRRQA